MDFESHMDGDMKIKMDVRVEKYPVYWSRCDTYDHTLKNVVFCPEEKTQFTLPEMREIVAEMEKLESAEIGKPWVQLIVPYTDFGGLDAIRPK